VIDPVDQHSFWPDPVAVASNGSGFLLAWAGNQIAVDNTLHAARVDAGGQLLDATAIPVAQKAGASESSPSVAAVPGGDYLVVYEESSHVLAKRISPAGQILDATPIAVSPTTGSNDYPDVVAGNGELLVVWNRGSQIVGNVVTPQGSVPAPAPFVIASGSFESRPKVAYGAGEYLVVWQ